MPILRRPMSAFVLRFRPSPSPMIMIQVAVAGCLLPCLTDPCLDKSSTGACALFVRVCRLTFLPWQFPPAQLSPSQGALAPSWRAHRLISRGASELSETILRAVTSGRPDDTLNAIAVPPGQSFNSFQLGHGAAARDLGKRSTFSLSLSLSLSYCVVTLPEHTRRAW